MPASRHGAGAMVFGSHLSTCGSPRARSFSCRRLASCASFGTRRLAGRGGTVAGAALPGGGVCVPRQRAMRCRGAAFAPQRAECRALPRPRRLAPLRGGGAIRTCLPPRGRRGCGRWRQLHAGAARLRQTDRNGLLRRAGAMLALAYVLHFLAHEFTRLGVGAFAAARIAPRVLDGSFEWHDGSGFSPTNSFRVVGSARSQCR